MLGRGANIVAGPADLVIRESARETAQATLGLDAVDVNRMGIGGRRPAVATAATTIQHTVYML